MGHRGHLNKRLNRCISGWIHRKTSIKISRYDNQKIFALKIWVMSYLYILQFQNRVEGPGVDYNHHFYGHFFEIIQSRKTGIMWLSNCFLNFVWIKWNRIQVPLMFQYISSFKLDDFTLNILEIKCLLSKTQLLPIGWSISFWLGICSKCQGKKGEKASWYYMTFSYNITCWLTKI